MRPLRGRSQVAGRKWQVASRKWQVASGKWQVASGKCNVCQVLNKVKDLAEGSQSRQGKSADSPLITQNRGMDADKIRKNREYPPNQCHPRRIKRFCVRSVFWFRLVLVRTALINRSH